MIAPSRGMIATHYIHDPGLRRQTPKLASPMRPQAVLLFAALSVNPRTWRPNSTRRVYNAAQARYV